MENRTLITVRDVQASADWYCKMLGLARGHADPITSSSSIAER